MYFGLPVCLSICLVVGLSVYPVWFPACRATCLRFQVCVFSTGLKLGLSTPLTVLENMQSLLQHQDVIRKAMTTLYGEVDETDTDNVGNVPYAMRFVGSNGFWRELEDVATLAEPLVMALGLSRSETITLGDAFYFLLAHGKRLSSGSRKGKLDRLEAPRTKYSRQTSRQIVREIEQLDR